ncbi:MAG: insulinase family protein, partial [Candidatus Omnitrophica bacterium]|nr:insulinase family protein [Candidatus Omnitrophota bacterium]
MKNKWVQVSLIIFWFIFGASAVFAGSAEKYVLDNGMTVIVEPMSKSATVSIYMLVKTGSATEGKYLGTGISHFVEHMLFKGTKKRAVGVIPTEVKAIGGKINASTGFDYTIYTLDVPNEAFSQGLDIVSDMIMNSTFDPAETAKERDVIFGEMRMINDRPERKLGDLLFQNAYLTHPYHHPTIGYIPLFGSITQDQLVDYYKTHYIPNNMILVVAGKVSSEIVLPEIQKTFERFSPKPYLLRNLPVEPQQTVLRYREVSYPSGITRIAMAYPSVSANDQNMFALDVLAMILGQGDSSRLFQEMVKNNKVADSVDASNYTPADRGVFEVSGDFENGNILQFIDGVNKVIDDIQLRGISQNELDKAVHQIMSALVFGQQVSSSVAYNAAVNEAMLGDFQFDEKYLEKVKQLTVSDVQRVAREYLREELLTTVVLKPQGQLAKATALSVDAKESSINKEVLSNGLTVLVKEDHTLPLATFFVTMRAGTRQEETGQNGLNQVTADLWRQGAGPWNSSEFARLVESRGAVISSTGGYNSLNLRMDFLSGDVLFALDMVEACIKKPRFDQVDFERQKDLAAANLRQVDDSILGTALRHLRELVFLHHPLRMEVAGTIADIQKLKREQVVNFYNSYLSPEHMVMSFYGDINHAQVLEEIKKRFSVLPKRKVELALSQEGFPQEIRQKIMSMDKEQAAVVLGFRAPDIYDRDRPGMEILSSVLGSSLNGRLCIKIREQLGKAYTLS